jgi:hypothetical protein
MRFIVVAVIAALSLPASPLVGTGAGQSQLATIAGTATSSAGETLPNATVQLRDLGTGTISSTTTCSSTGTFNFIGLHPGTYVVELVNAAGQVGGTSASVPLAAGAAVTGVAVGLAAAAIGGTAATFASVSTIVAVTSAAAAAGVVGVVSRGARRSDASPSR